MATMKQIFGNMKKGLATGNFTLNGLVQTLQHYCEDLENSTGGGGGGSTVSYTQTLESGSECGTITIDGVGTKIYAPTPAEPTDVEVTQVQTTGTKIATISVDNVATDIYAPAGGGGVGAWTLAGTQTGTTAVDISDLTFNELLIEFNIAGEGQYITIAVAAPMLSTTAKNFRGGHGLSSFPVCAEVNITTSSVAISAVFKSSTDVTSTSTITVYYR